MGPFAERDLADERGLDPVRPAFDLGALGKRAVCRRHRVELLLQVAEVALAEAGADVACILQRAVGVVHAEQQRAEIGARPGRIGIAGDHEFLAALALQLDPVGAARAAVRRALALADDAFQAERERRLDHAVGRRVEHFAEADARRGRLRNHAVQQCAARFQRRDAQVVAIEVRQVEEVVDDVLGAARIERVLQRAEVGHALRIRHHDLAVVPARRQARFTQAALQGTELGRPVVAVAGDELHVVAVDAGEHPVAVELDLVDPRAGIARRCVGKHGELRRELVGQRGRLGFGRQHGLRARLATWRLLCRRRRARGRRGLRHRQRLHAVGQLVDHAELGGRPHVGIALLDEQPRLLFFVVLLDPHQHPAAVQLVAVQVELEVALAQALVRIAHRTPEALVPDDDLARAVLLRGDGAFEAGIRQRVILDVDRHALFLRIEARALGHGPAHQRAVEFEPEVVVQPARPVLLHHEGQAIGSRNAAFGRLRRDLEITLGAVAAQGGVGCGCRSIGHAVRFSLRPPRLTRDARRRVGKRRVGLSEPAERCQRTASRKSTTRRVSSSSRPSKKWRAPGTMTWREPRDLAICARRSSAPVRATSQSSLP